VKVLLTGVGGQLGQTLAGTLPDGLELVPATHAELDIGDEAAVSAFVTRVAPDLIINAAAYTAVDQAESDPDAARRVNEDGARHLAAAAAQAGARMIHISTDFVFDGARPTPYAPDSTPNPLGTYGATKLAGERATLETLPGNAVVLRTAWLYAPHGRNFLLTMLRLLREQGSVSVVADQIGTPTATASLADAIWVLAERADVAGICHWTDAGVASWYDFAVAIAEEGRAANLLSGPLEVVPIATGDYPTTARRPRFSVLDTRSTSRALGIVPRHWRANLRSVLGELELG
jgi:dTDP-4-dehydrorhamnose reductase